MTDARDGSSRTIRQFHFTAWPEETEVPRQADYFIDLIGQVWYLLRFYIEDLLARNLVLFCYIKLYYKQKSAAMTQQSACMRKFIFHLNKSSLSSD